MKKITNKMWMYGINYLTKNINFNLSLIFAIVALVFLKDGFTIWAILSVTFASIWIFQLGISHLLWALMNIGERALWLAIRKHGRKIIEITDAEVTKKGQKDMLGILNDADAGLEIKMMVNGTGTLVNTFVGIKWLINARRFHNHKNEFTYHITSK